MDNKWVEVSERLPENFQRCLIYDVSCHVSFNGRPETITHIYTARFYKGSHKPNGPWTGCDTGFGNNEFSWNWEEGARQWFSQSVSHWMPLPDSPVIENPPCVHIPPPSDHHPWISIRQVKLDD